MRALAGAWFGATTNRRILGAAATLAGLSLLVRCASLVKDLAVAYRFGTGDAFDAFLIALLLPTFAINVVANSLNSAFVPIFIEVREREAAASADRLFRSVLALSIAASGALDRNLFGAPIPVCSPCSDGASSSRQRTTAAR